MKKFKVSVVDRKKANQLLMNSNKLSACMYNLGNTFLVNENDLSECKLILTRNMIKMSLVD